MASSAGEGDLQTKTAAFNRLQHLAVKWEKRRRDVASGGCDTPPNMQPTTTSGVRTAPACGGGADGEDFESAVERGK